MSQFSESAEDRIIKAVRWVEAKARGGTQRETSARMNGAIVMARCTAALDTHTPSTLYSGIILLRQNTLTDHTWTEFGECVLTIPNPLTSVEWPDYLEIGSIYACFPTGEFRLFYPTQRDVPLLQTVSAEPWRYLTVEGADYDNPVAEVSTDTRRVIFDGASFLVEEDALGVNTKVTRVYLRNGFTGDVP